MSRGKTLRGLAGVAAVAAAMLASPAVARRIGPDVPLAEPLAAYKAVCVAHPGDPDAQIDAVKAMPGFTEVEPTDDGTRNFENGRVRVRILDGEDVSYCGAQGQAAAGTRLSDLVALGNALYGDAEDVNDRSASWISRDKGMKITHVYILSDRDEDGLEAAFLMGTRK